MKRFARHGNRPSHARSRGSLGIRALCASLGLASFVGFGGCETNTSTEDVLPSGPLLMRPADHREPKRSEVNTPLPPIQGGSLLVTSDGSRAIVGDIDRHRIVGVSLAYGEVSFEVPVSATAMPGRMVEDDDGRVHVVMRGLGQLWTLWPESGAVTRRRDVCKEPRGLAYESALRLLHLACADGTLASFDVDGGKVQRELTLVPDLRDVLIDGSGGLWVSTFRAGRIFHVNAEGTLTRAPALEGAEKFAFRESDNDFLVATGAFRMVGDGRGGATLVHQRSQITEVRIDPHAKLSNQVTGEDVFEPLDFDEVGSSYGGGAIESFDIGQSNCDGIVHSAVSHLGQDGVASASDALPNAVLAVDVAHGADGRIAVAIAGQRDPGAPKAVVLDDSRPTVPESDCANCAGSVQVLREQDLASGVRSFCASPIIIPVEEPAVGVAFTPDGRQLLVQVRQPARLYVVNVDTPTTTRRIDLGGASVQDTGHDLFHRDSGGGIACASCHLEGAEDGHTWSFTGLGPRRTQPLNVGLEGTAPFHWDGLMEGLGAIMNEVFVGRMGGAPQSPERVEVLEQWVGTLTPPAPMRPSADPKAQRGKRLFEDGDVGCRSCHTGDKLTNNTSVDVGTSDGVPLQVPSLLGVAFRLPVMHDGCAHTLQERFDPDCGGGDAHGHTSQLTDDEIDDLVAYLETL